MDIVDFTYDMLGPRKVKCTIQTHRVAEISLNPWFSWNAVQFSLCYTLQLRLTERNFQVNSPNSRKAFQSSVQLSDLPNVTQVSDRRGKTSPNKGQPAKEWTLNQKRGTEMKFTRRAKRHILKTQLSICNIQIIN